MPPRAVPLVASLLAAGCGGGSSSEPDGLRPPTVIPSTAAEGDDAVAISPYFALQVDPRRLCPTAGEVFDPRFESFRVAVDVAGEPVAPTDPEVTDVSATVSLESGLGDSLEIVSRGDGALTLRMSDPDIVSLTGSVDGVQPVTVYVGGFPVDARADTLLRKRVAGGCLYALRLGGAGYCGTTLSRGPGSGRFGSGGRYVELDGCEYAADPDIDVVDF